MGDANYVSTVSFKVNINKPPSAETDRSCHSHHSSVMTLFFTDGSNHTFSVNFKTTSAIVVGTENYPAKSLSALVHQGRFVADQLILIMLYKLSFPCHFSTQL